MDTTIEAQDGFCTFRLGDGEFVTEMVVQIGPCKAVMPLSGGGPTRKEVLDNCRRLHDALDGEWTWESVEHDVHVRLALDGGRGRLHVRCEPQWQSDSAVSFDLAVDQSGLPKR